MAGGIMKALVVDHAARDSLRFADIPDPVPGPNQVLIDVRAVSLNHGTVGGYLSMNDGEVPGWDSAGVVIRSAADADGPSVGTAVVGLGWHGAWAQRRVVDVVALAVLPEEVDFGAASTLGTAALTALQSLRRLGPLSGQRVLITGASGGVGRFAVQLAKREGAFVICQVGNKDRGEGLGELHADEIVTSLDMIERPINGALDIVGGPGLSKIFGLLADGGSVQSIGSASGEPTVFEPGSTVGNPRRRLESFTVDPGTISNDLTYLVSFLSSRVLDPQIGWRGDWNEYSEAFSLLLGRKIRGKAVLDIV